MEHGISGTAGTKTVVVIAGPTAVGKTALAIRLAKELQTEIISADSRQCYRELKIGVARPSEEELASVRHHFIATHSIHTEVNAATFEQYALQLAAELFQRQDTLVMTGGTGLYLKAFTDGLQLIPPVDPGLRRALREQYATHGMSWLIRELETSDPLFAQTGEMQNPQRMLRALEVFRTSGRSIVSFQTGFREPRPFRMIRVALEVPRPELTERIRMRVDTMMQDGLLAEVVSLQDQQHLNALQTVGYRELFSHLAGQLSINDAVDQISTHTRQYAKRQMTWFKNNPEYRWFHPADLQGILGLLRKV